MDEEASHLQWLYLIRSGDRELKLQAANMLRQLALDRNKNGAILDAGGLHLLVCLFISSREWPDVQEAAAKAVTSLAALAEEGTHLLDEAPGVLQALSFGNQLNENPRAAALALTKLAHFAALEQQEGGGGLVQRASLGGS